jgi:hypothetical protein
VEKAGYPSSEVKKSWISSLVLLVSQVSVSISVGTSFVVRVSFAFLVPLSQIVVLQDVLEAAEAVVGAGGARDAEALLEDLEEVLLEARVRQEAVAAALEELCDLNSQECCNQALDLSLPLRSSPRSGAVSYPFSIPCMCLNPTFSSSKGT